jgi:hypothetical protein
MKKLFFMAAVVLAGSVPAHAQLGGSVPKVNFNPPPVIPRAVFSTTAVSGSAQDFYPSTFVLFKDAYDQGKASLNTPPKTLAEIAAEYRQTPRAKAKVIFTQDAYGDAVIESQ